MSSLLAGEVTAAMRIRFCLSANRNGQRRIRTTHGGDNDDDHTKTVWQAVVVFSQLGSDPDPIGAGGYGQLRPTVPWQHCMGTGVLSFFVPLDPFLTTKLWGHNVSGRQ
jgi:hypothetical protein